MKNAHYTPNTSTVYTAPAIGYLITWRLNINTQMYRDASGNEFRGTDMLCDAQPFATRELAQAEIDNGGYTLCSITEAPQDDVLVYRADSYRANMGDLRGFFLTWEDAMDALRVGADDETDYPGDDFEQITLFAVSPDVLDGVDIADNEAMLVESIWGAGNIIETFYFN